jgi:hypothetical protein
MKAPEEDNICDNNLLGCMVQQKALQAVVVDRWAIQELQRKNVKFVTVNRKRTTDN